MVTRLKISPSWPFAEQDMEGLLFRQSPSESDNPDNKVNSGAHTTQPKSRLLNINARKIDIVRLHNGREKNIIHPFNAQMVMVQS